MPEWEQTLESLSCAAFADWWDALVDARARAEAAEADAERLVEVARRCPECYGCHALAAHEALERELGTT